MADTVTVQDAEGNDIEAEVGADGKNPVTVDNPPAKAERVTDSDANTDGMVKVADAEGNEFYTEVGADGKNPVTVDNPPAKAKLPSSDDAKEDAPVESPPEPENDGRPAGNASRDDWAAYAKTEAGGSNTDEQLEGMTRDEIRGLYT